MLSTGTDSQGAANVDVPFDLRAGERVLKEYRPKFRLFAQRTLLIGIVTTIAFGSIPGLDISYAQQVGLALLVVMAWVFVFDEWQEWRDCRRDLWVLTNHRLVFINPDEDIEQAWLNLGDIRVVSRILWWSLRIKGSDGRATLMPYVGPVTAVRDDILLAKEGRLDG